jgi:hypothetical protein
MLSSCQVAGRTPGGAGVKGAGSATAGLPAAGVKHIRLPARPHQNTSPLTGQARWQWLHARVAVCEPLPVEVVAGTLLPLLKANVGRTQINQLIVMMTKKRQMKMMPVSMLRMVGIRTWLYMGVGNR